MMTALRGMVAEMRAKADCYTHIRLDLKKRFYHLLLRAMDAVKDEQLPAVLDAVPKTVAASPEIEAFLLAETIKNGTTDQDAILEFVLRTKQYWLLVRYCISFGDCGKTLDILHQSKFLIGQNQSIFDLAIDATCQSQGEGAALDLLKGYEQIYGNLTEFWTRAYTLSETDENRQWVIDAIVSRLHAGKLQYSHFFSQKMLAEILLKENRFTEPLELLTAIEEMGLGDTDIIRMKLHIYTYSERQIDALAEIEKHYEELKDDEQILGVILQISLQYKRTVKEDVLDRAKKCRNASILLLAARFEQERQNIDEAEKLAMQAMLITPPEEEALFIDALPLLIEDPSQEIKTSSYVKENTFFVAENMQHGSRLTFCIYREYVLPHTDYYWKDAQHIDIDSAVSQGFLRLSVGDTIEIQGSQYKITEIGPLSGFFVRVCIDSLEHHNLTWSIPVDEPGELRKNIVKLFQENPQLKQQNWIPYYSDFSHPACSIYLLKSSTNLEYAQSMRALMDDTSIIMRDCLFPAKEDEGKEYIITYTALAALDHLNINLQKYYGKLIIPSSVAVTARREADAVLKNNSRNLVASMAVQNDQVQIIKPTDEMIRISSQQAIKFKRYVAKLTTAENTRDWSIPERQKVNLVQLVGICDYDALILAHTRDAVLATCEMMTAGLTLRDEMKADTVGIADFLCLMNVEITTLLDTLKRMLQYRFCTVITPTVIRHVMKVYDVANREEQQAIESAWNDILTVPDSLADKGYIKAFGSVYFETIRLLVKGGLFYPHPIMYIFNCACFLL